MLLPNAGPASAGSTSSPTRSAPSWSCSTPRCPLGHLGPRLDQPVRRRRSTAPRSPCPAGSPAPATRSPACCAAPSIVIAAGGYPADEGERAAGRGLPIVVCPPGVDTDRFRPVDAPTSGAAVRARFGLDARVDARRGERQPARAPQGHGRAHPGRRPPRRASTRGSRSSSAAAGRDRRPARTPRRSSWRRRCGSSAGWTTPTCPACTAPPTCSPWTAATAGSASSRRGSASCSWRRRRAASPQVAGESGRSGRGGGRRRDRPRGRRTRVRSTLVADALDGCSPTPACAAAMGGPAAERAVEAFSYDGWPPPGPSPGVAARRASPGLTGPARPEIDRTPPGAGMIAPCRPRPTASGSGRARRTRRRRRRAPVDEPWPDGPPASPGLIRLDLWGTVVFTVLSVVGARRGHAGHRLSGRDLRRRAVRRRLHRVRMGLCDRGRPQPRTTRSTSPASSTSPQRAARRPGDRCSACSSPRSSSASRAAAVRPFTVLAFCVLAPVWGLGLITLWSARHGRFPPRGQRRPDLPGRGDEDAAEVDEAD